MSEEGGEGKGLQESFLWENPVTWVQSIDSDNLLLPDQPSKSNSSKKQDISYGVNKKRGRGGGGDKEEGNLLKGSDKKKVKEGESEHEIHIWTERERRKKMRNMFSNLHALLPQLPPKADKSTIVDEAVSYIKNLQHTLQNLQKQKLEITTQNNFKLAAAFNNSREKGTVLADHHNQGPSRNLLLGGNSTTDPVIFQTWTSSNVVLNICGDEAHISICSPKNKPAAGIMFSTICYVLEKHKIEVVSAQVSSDLTRRMYMIQAHVNGASDQFTEALPVEEIYKQAAGELMFWISS